jgi:hypothetical protein
MTRENAIRELKIFSGTTRIRLSANFWEALNTAIKALEQEHCEDWYDVPSDEMTLEQARQAVKNLRKKLAEYLEQEPSWISTCEKLPEEDGEYLLFGKIDEDEENYIFVGEYDSCGENFGIWQEQFDRTTLGCLGSEFFEYASVEAWMPLPKAYKAESEEE